MAKSPCCAKATHCSKAAFHFKELHIVWVLLQEYGILSSTLEEMRSLKVFSKTSVYTRPFVSRETMSFTFNAAIKINEGW